MTAHDGTSCPPHVHAENPDDPDCHHHHQGDHDMMTTTTTVARYVAATARPARAPERRPEVGAIGHKGYDLVRWTGTRWAALTPDEVAAYDAARAADLADLGALCTVSAGWTIGGPS